MPVSRTMRWVDGLGWGRGLPADEVATSLGGPRKREGSADYNQMHTLKPGQRPTWNSDEGMKRSDEQYRLTVIVEHNRDPVLPEAGSCILLHVWPAPGISSPGCTMMSLADMEVLLKWLDPHASPVVVQLPRAIAGKAIRAWGLPADLAFE